MKFGMIGVCGKHQRGDDKLTEDWVRLKMAKINFEDKGLSS